MTQIDTFDENPELIRHTIFNIIRKFNSEFRNDYGEMILCMDHTRNWRKDTFPQYKANRKKSRDNSIHDWNTIFSLLDEVRDDIIKFSPYRTVRVERCEADDIIGTICERSNTPEPILIISPDTDFIQLQRYPNVKQYSNLQKKWVVPKVDPITDLEDKVLKGDTGDGVPNVMSDDEVLITEGSRQTPLSKRKIVQLKNDPESLGVSVARRIIRNRNMIDLTRTPDDLKDEIMEQYNKKAKGSITSMMTLFTKHRMKLMMESLSDFEVVSNNK